MIGILRNVLAIGMVVIGILTSSPSPIAAKNPPTTITSQTMTANNKSGTVTFQGNVHLIQADLDVTSDEMIVRFTTDESSKVAETQSTDQGGKRKISVIEAKGNVVIKKGEGKATCGHAIYFKDEERIVLTESPIAWQAGTRVSGPKMTMYLKEDRSVVEGGTNVLIEEQEGI